jgi:hypothetical protein
LEASSSEKLVRPISINKPDVVSCACHPNYTGGGGTGLWSEAGSKKNCKNLLENKQKQKGLVAWVK